MGSGIRVDQLEDREKVHQKFGAPINRDQSDGLQTEDYVTHRKIADDYSGMSMGYAFTWGLGELIWFPYSSYQAIHRSILGQHLKFYYNMDGKVQKIERDGEYKWSPKEYRETTNNSKE